MGGRIDSLYSARAYIRKGGEFMIPVDLFSLIVGMALGAGIYWLATHVDVWLDDDKKATSHDNER